MKSFVIILCAVLLSASLKSQLKGVGGLADAIPAMGDTAIINSLNKKSVDSYLFDPDSARAKAEKALILSKQLKYRRGQGMSYAAIGYTYWAQSCFSLSLYNLLNALEYLKEAKEYAELSMCNRIIARNYMEMHEYTLSTQFLGEAESNAILSKDNFKISLVYNESSLLELRQHNYDKAWGTAKTALVLSIKNNDTLLKGIIYSRLGGILEETGKKNLAKNYFDSAYSWAQLSHNNRLRAYLLLNYASYFLDKGQVDSALGMAKAASFLADTIGNNDIKLQAAALIVQTYKSANDVLNELAYRRIYNALQDSIRNDGIQKSFKLLLQFFTIDTRLHDMEAQEQAAAISKERIRFQHVIIVALVIFIAILMAGLMTIYYLYNEKKRIANQLVERNNAVTEQKSIIEEQSRNLEVLNNLKTKLFAVISHDLRAPISNLRSIMGLFQQKELTEDQTVALLKRMLPALDGTDLTLSNLLNWSVKQMNGLKASQSNALVFQMADEIQKIFEFALEQKNIQLSIDLSVDSKVYCDEHHLKIVLRNLVSNAIKFTPRGGTIIIGEHNTADKMAIYVKDTGQGISAEDLGKLFVPTLYFTTRGTSGEKGTGLGLLLCKELLELNNGSIRVESAVGAGSTFFIELPKKEG